MALPNCDCYHVDYCGLCMNEGYLAMVNTHTIPGKPFCREHGFLSEQQIVRGFPEGHCGHA